jgi:uncharacterized membrane protein YhaH (DUF805 family)
MDWMLMPYRRYFDFSGRSRRKEFWMFFLFMFLVMFVLAIVMMLTVGAGLGAMMQGGASPGMAMAGGMGFVGVLLLLFVLGSFIPSLAVQVRRLHDLNQTGWLLLGVVIVLAILNMIPRVGPILYALGYIAWLVYLAMPGTPGPNKYGADPKDPTSAEVFA